MPKIAKELSALEVKRLCHPGGKPSNHYVAVGTVRGLYLQITRSNARSWLLRATIGKKRREIGLGPYPETGLADAFEKARAVRSTIAEGRDPIQDKADAKAALIASQMRSLTFAQAIDRYMQTGYIQSLRTDKQRQLWRNTLETYAVPHIGDLRTADITVDDVKRVLAPMWNEKRETGVKVRGRVESVIDWAIDGGYRIDPNPASKSVLSQWIKDQGAANVVSRPAVPLDAMADWFAALGRHKGMAAKALQFLALTAVRADNVLGATWDEIDRDARIWTIPATRMKGRGHKRYEHRVPLCDTALAMIDAIDRRKNVDLLFPAPRDGQLSNAAIGKAMKAVHKNEIDAGQVGFIDRQSGKPAVPHGLRSTFKDWAAERTSYPLEMSEIALAHKMGSKVEAAYRRGDMIERRRAMMADWAAFCEGNATKAGKVVKLFA